MRKTTILGSRSDKMVIDQFARKFRRIIKSQGKPSAEIWLEKNAIRQVGKGKDTRRNVKLPVSEFRAILANS